MIQLQRFFRAFSFFLILGGIFFSIQGLAKSELKSDHVKVSFYSFAQKLNPQDELIVGVYFSLDPHWHVYWQNPGDSGAAPKFIFDENLVQVQKVTWPIPKRIPVGDLTNYGYETSVLFPIKIKLKNSANQTQPIQVAVKLEWLVCKVECIPGFGELTIDIPRAERTETLPDDSEVGRLFLNAFSSAPQSNSDWKISTLAIDSARIQIQLEATIAVNKIEELLVAPLESEIFTTASPSIAVVDNETLTVDLPLESNASLGKKISTPVLVSYKQSGKVEGFYSAVALHLNSHSLFWKSLLLAVLGGVLLNLMPCVFPILSLKVFSLVQEDKRLLRVKSAWAFTMGVLVSFLILSVGLLVLRHLGQFVGWGFQLQSPIFVFFLIVLFFTMGLYFFGLIEWGDRFVAMSDQGRRLKFLSGSFGTGVLAVLVATPCTAPFMGSAIGATLLLPPLQSVFVFLSLGFGLALPLLALSYVPQWGKLLPKPGAWMVQFKEFMAFPMWGTCIWLFWVLVIQKGASASIWMLLTLLGIGLSLWLHRSFATKSVRALKILVFLLSLVFPAYKISKVSEPSRNSARADSSRVEWLQFSPSRIEELRRQNKAIFIDFTAAWCITCQWNKKSTLDTPEIETLFKAHQVELFRADWTSFDPVITKALAEFGRNSVPLYIYYAPGGAARVLPEILTKEILYQLFNKK